MFICHMDKARTAKVISGDRKYIVAMKVAEKILSQNSTIVLHSQMQKHLNLVKNNSWNTINNKSVDLRVNVFFLAYFNDNFHLIFRCH